MGNKYSQPTEQLTTSETTDVVRQLEKEEHTNDSSPSIGRPGGGNTVMGNLLSHGEEQQIEREGIDVNNNNNDNVAVEPIQWDANAHQHNLRLPSAGVPPIASESPINSEPTEDDCGTADCSVASAAVSTVRLDQALVRDEERLTATLSSTTEHGNNSDKRHIVAKSPSTSQEYNSPGKESVVTYDPLKDELDDNNAKIQETSKVSPPVTSTGIIDPTATLQQLDGNTSKMKFQNMEIEETATPSTNTQKCVVNDNNSRPIPAENSDSPTSPLDVETDVIVPTMTHGNKGKKQQESDEMEIDSPPIHTAARVSVESSTSIIDQVGRTELPNTLPTVATLIPTPPNPTQQDASKIEREGTNHPPCIRAAYGGAAKEVGISERWDFGSGTEDIRLKSLPLNIEAKGDSVQPPNLLEKVKEALDDIDSCSICAGGVAPHLPFNVGLVVDGVGHLSLPLPDEQAKALSSIGTKMSNGNRPGPGQGSVEVDKSRLQIRNPKWTSSLEDLVTKAITALGVPRNHDITCKLSKLVLQREESTLLKSSLLKSTNSNRGYFAALVIQLPSTFAGGEWIVGHGGKTQLLALDDDAEFRCHYCMFRTDCDVDFDYNFTGRRLSLVYTLHYDCGDDHRNSTPSAEAILAKQGQFNTLVRRLPSVQQVFLFPLNGKYTSSSLARYGINAFGDEDQKKVRAINNATMGTWNLAVVECYKTEQKRGVEEDQNHRASLCEPSLAREAFSAGGGQIVLPWINDVVDFSSCQAGGMVLADVDTLAASWEKSFRNGHVVGSSRRTFYKMRLLLAWSDEGMMQVLRRSNLNAAMQLASHADSWNGAQLVLDSVVQGKRTLSWGMFCKLGEQLLSASNSKSRQIAIMSLFDAMPTKALPSPGSTSILQSFLSDCADLKPELLDSIRSRVLLPPDHYDSMLSFVRRYEVAMALQNDYATMAESKSVVLEMQEKFAASLPRSIVGDCDDSTYPLYARQMKLAILRLTSRYSWEHIKNALCPIVGIFLDARDRSLDDFSGKIGLIQAVARITKSDEVALWLKALAGKVTTELANPVFTTNCPGSTGSAGLFAHSHFGSCLEVLLEFGTVEHFDRLARWSTSGKLENVEQLTTYLRKQGSDSQNSVSEAAKEGIEKMNGEFKKRKVESLLAEKSSLEILTQFGPPPFSWTIRPSGVSLPDAIQQFLGRNEPGPLAYTHWQGARYSRGLARCSGPGYRIQAASFAVVIVKKTKEHHAIAMEGYEQRITRLRALEKEIAGLGGPLPIDTSPSLQAPDLLHTGKENISMTEDSAVNKYFEYTVPFYPGKLGLVVEQQVASLGFKVIRLLEGGQANRCGKIERGDFLTRIDGRKIDSLDALRSDKNGMREFVFTRSKNATAQGSDNTGECNGSKRDQADARTELDHPSKKPRLAD